jgi:hypothetical protein
LAPVDEPGIERYQTARGWGISGGTRSSSIDEHFVLTTDFAPSAQSDSHQLALAAIVPAPVTDRIKVFALWVV